MFKKPIDLGDPVKMPEACPHCGQDFVIEPGFYWGAMYISYLIIAFTMGPVAFFCAFYLDWEIMKVMLLLVAMIVTLFIFYMRLSRSIWIHIVVKYDPLSK